MSEVIWDINIFAEYDEIETHPTPKWFIDTYYFDEEDERVDYKNIELQPEEAEVLGLTPMFKKVHELYEKDLEDAVQKLSMIEWMDTSWDTNMELDVFLEKTKNLLPERLRNFLENLPNNFDRLEGGGK